MRIFIIAIMLFLHTQITAARLILFIRFILYSMGQYYKIEPPPPFLPKQRTGFKNTSVIFLLRPATPPPILRIKMVRKEKNPFSPPFFGVEATTHKSRRKKSLKMPPKEFFSIPKTIPLPPSALYRLRQILPAQEK